MTRFLDTWWGRLGACLVSALLLWMGSPGIDQTWTLPFALVPWVLVSARGGRFRKLLDALTGITTLSLWLYWLADLIGAAFVIVLVVECLQWVFVGVTLRATRGRIPLWLALAVSWTGFEFLLGTQPIGGFPWLFLGHGFYAWTWVLHTAAFWGVLGISFLAAATAGVVSEDVLDGRCRRVRWGVLACGWMVVLSLGAWRSQRAVAWERGPSIVAIQPNIEQGLKMGLTAEEIYERAAATSVEAVQGGRALRRAFRAAFTGGLAVPEPLPTIERGEEPAAFGPDLLVWPETKLLWGLGDGQAGDVYEDPGRRYPMTYEVSRLLENELIRERLGRNLLAPSHTSFGSGALYYVEHGGGWRQRNAFLLFGADLGYGRAARYDKRRLVPGGEFIPIIDDLPNVDAIRAWLIETVGYLPDLTPGHEVGVMHLTTREGERVRFGVQVCYDNAYWDPFLDATRAGARFHLVASNEGWYGTSVEFDHMRAFSSFRAVETARSVVRVTNTGTSMLVDPLGRVSREVRDGEGRDRAVSGWLWVRPPLDDERTLYVATGELLGPACILVWFLWAVSRLGARIRARFGRRPEVHRVRSETAG
ncbi:MAG: apolipoprotein N-acyltransferase [Planctomycetes bacterium]|nr:apolipoprotein N-acyltransferase [Planctomycetota bacterium]